MNHTHARTLWGANAVARALDGPAPALTRELALRVADAARDLDAQSFAAWALGLPWPEFCAVVRLCSGNTRRALEAA